MNFEESHDAEVKVSTKLINDEDYNVILSGEMFKYTSVYKVLHSYSMNSMQSLSCQPYKVY